MGHENRFFPHLLPQDIEVWKRFLDDLGKQYNRFEYDVRVGEGRDPGPDHERNIREMAIGLSQRRIDAIGFRNGSATIFEITTRAGLTCIGQLKVYPQLYKTLHPSQKTAAPILIAETIQDDVLPYLLESGQRFLLYPG